MSDTTTRYVPYDYRRVCDVCGNLRNRSQMVERPGYLFVCAYHVGERTELELSEAIANTRPFEILPVPDPKPQDNYQPQDYTGWEAQIFNFVAATAPAGSLGGASNAFSAAEAAIYMGDIVLQGTRPTVWLSTAKTVLATCLTYLLTQQNGSPTGPVVASSNIRWGGFLSSTTVVTSTAIFAGRAFLRGYRVLGTPAYLTAANACATFLRRMQCADLESASGTVFPNGGNPYHIGGLSSSVDNTTGVLSNQYDLVNVSALTFFSELAAIVGASTVYGDSSATAGFSAATAATLTTMMSELRSFAVSGAKSTATNALVVGLSSTAPESVYFAWLSGGGGPGEWNTPASTPGRTYAIAARGLFDAFGMAEAKVTEVIAFLAALTANPANATPSTNSADQTLAGTTGTYSAAIAPPTNFTPTAPFTEATGALYDFAALGILSPVLATAGGTYKANLQASRDTLSNPQPVSTFLNYIGERYLGPVGSAGLSLQPTGTPSVNAASEAGGIYRQDI